MSKTTVITRGYFVVALREAPSTRPSLYPSIKKDDIRKVLGVYGNYIRFSNGGGLYPTDYFKALTAIETAEFKVDRARSAVEAAQVRLDAANKVLEATKYPPVKVGDLVVAQGPGRLPFTIKFDDGEYVFGVYKGTSTACVFQRSVHKGSFPLRKI